MDLVAILVLGSGEEERYLCRIDDTEQCRELNGAVRCGVVCGKVNSVRGNAVLRFFGSLLDC
jgi:hypothetical protein